MKTSQVAVFQKAGERMELKRFPIPELQAGEILVRNEYTTLCRSDLYTYSGKRKEKTPTILGHEIVGRIIQFGPQASLVDLNENVLSVGDRVSWAIYASDPNSKYAQIGIPQKGTDLFKYGHERITEKQNLHGGLSEYIILRKNTPLLKLEESIPVSVAATINCAVATARATIRLAGTLKGKNVLVMGAGMLGIMACAICATQGAKSILAYDREEDRLKLATAFGAQAGVNASDLDSLKQFVGFIHKEDKPIQVILDFIGHPNVMELAFGVLDIGGTVVWAGATYPQPDLNLNAEQVVRNLWTIKGLHNYNEEDFRNAVRFMAAFHTAFPFEILIHDEFVLEQVNEAFEYALEQNPYRVGISLM